MIRRDSESSVVWVQTKIADGTFLGTISFNETVLLDVTSSFYSYYSSSDALLPSFWCFMTSFPRFPTRTDSNPNTSLLMIIKLKVTTP